MNPQASGFPTSMPGAVRATDFEFLLVHLGVRPSDPEVPQKSIFCNKLTRSCPVNKHAIWRRKP